MRISRYWKKNSKEIVKIDTILFICKNFPKKVWVWVSNCWNQGLYASFRHSDGPSGFRRIDFRQTVFSAAFQPPGCPSLATKVTFARRVWMPARQMLSTNTNIPALTDRFQMCMADMAVLVDNDRNGCLCPLPAASERAFVRSLFASRSLHLRL